MKQVSILAMAVIIALSLVACGSDTSAAPESSTVSAEASSAAAPSAPEEQSNSIEPGEGIGENANGLAMHEIGPITMDLPKDFVLVDQNETAISYKGDGNDVVSVSAIAIPLDFDRAEITEDLFAQMAAGMLQEYEILSFDNTMAINDHPTVVSTFQGTREGGLAVTVSMIYYIIDDNYCVISLIYPSDGSGSLIANFESVVDSILPI